MVTLSTYIRLHVSTKVLKSRDKSPSPTHKLNLFGKKLICSIFGFTGKAQVEKEIAKPRYQGSLIQKQSQHSLLNRNFLSSFLFLEAGSYWVAWLAPKTLLDQASLKLEEASASASCAL